METSMLKAQISVLLVKGYKFSDTLIKFQKGLKERFKEDYNLDEIEDELIVLKFEQEDIGLGQVKEIPDDHFEHYGI